MPRTERKRKEDEKKRSICAKRTKSITGWFAPTSTGTDTTGARNTTTMVGSEDKGDEPTSSAVQPVQVHPLSVLMETSASAGTIGIDETEIINEKNSNIPNSTEMINRDDEGDGEDVEIQAETAENQTTKEQYLRECVNKGPTQKKNSNFPKSKGRSFNLNWYTTRPWLEYESESDSMKCFSCRLFVSDKKWQKSVEFWAKNGVRNWKKGIEKLDAHSMTEAHITGVLRWKCFKTNSLKNAFAASSVVQKSKNDELRKENREVLTRIIDIVVHLGRQNQAFRGHNEKENSSNKGNFLETVSLLARYDVVLNRHLMKLKAEIIEKKACRSQVSLLSNRTQNDVISAVGQHIQDQILKEVKAAKIFSILADDTSDVSHKEQFAIVLRYVFNGEIKERFIEMCDVVSTKSADLETVVLNCLQKHGLSLENVRGQAYDGAANMKGVIQGLQKRILQHNDKALYVHCFAHCLNLVLVEASTCVKDMSIFFNTVQMLYCFLTNSIKRHAMFVEIQMDLYPGKPTHELQKMSDTRWACRERTLQTLTKRFDCILQLLERIETGDDNKAAAEARLLLRQVNFSFILCLLVARPIFQATAILSNVLQKKEVDLVTAMNKVDSLQNFLQEERKEDRFKQVYEEAVKECEKHDIELPSTILGQKRAFRIPQRYEDSITQNHQFSSLEDYFRVQLYYPFLDSICSELQARFSGQNETTRNILIGLSYVLPNVYSGSDKQKMGIKEVCTFYGVEDKEQQVIAEIRVLQNDQEFQQFQNELEKQKKVRMQPVHLTKYFYDNDLEEVFPVLSQLVKLLVTLPITSASAERSFSKLNLIKNYLRNKMAEERLSHLVMISAERDIPINTDMVIDIFKRNGHRRLLL